MTALSIGILVLLVAGNPAEAAERPTPAAIGQAKIRFEDGMAAYQGGDFTAAIRLFGEAHALSKAPGLLFNLGQAYRRSGDCARALDAYLAYREAAPQARNRELTDRYVDEQRRCVENKRREIPPPPPRAPPASPAPVVAVAPVAASPPAVRPGHRGVGFGLLALSAAGAVTGTIFAVDASRSSDSVSAIFDRGGTWDPSAAQLEEEGRRAKVAAVVSLSVAFASAAVAAWLILRR